MRTVLHLGNVLPPVLTSPDASNERGNEGNLKYGKATSAAAEIRHRSVRQYLLDELGHRYRELAPTAGGCTLSVEDRQRCPKDAVLSDASANEIKSVATAVTDAFSLSGRENGAGSSRNNGGAEDHASTRPTLAHGYHDSVTKLLVADYIEDLAAGVLGPTRVCLFFKCLASHGSWVEQTL